MLLVLLEFKQPNSLLKKIRKTFLRAEAYYVFYSFSDCEF